MEGYEELSNEELNHQIKISDNVFSSCPNSPRKRKPDYFRDLLEHAIAVRSCNSKKRRARDEADVVLCLCPPKRVDESHPLADQDRDEMFVWPWIGIVVNIQTGSGGSKLCDELITKGFNPIRVIPLWNHMGHSGNALVEFSRDWSGFKNAMSFEKAYEADHHGKIDWKKGKNIETSDLYAWVARADDYISSGIIGKNLRKMGDVKTIADIIDEEDRKVHKLVDTLRYKEMENKFKETLSSLGQVIMEDDELHQSYNEEITKLQSTAREHFEKIFGDYEKTKFQLETREKELYIRSKEVEQREARNVSERKKLVEELEKNVTENSSLNVASVEQKKLRILAEKQQRQNEALHKRIIQLEKDLDQKQALQLEFEVLSKAKTLQDMLIEKEAELEDLTILYQALIVYERNCDDQLQDARKELINGLKEYPIESSIGIKRMGELNNKPFLEAMKKKYKKKAEAEERVWELCMLLEEYLKDPDWRPTKFILVGGKLEEVFDEDDERLKELKSKYGNAVYDSVTTALGEIIDYNPELWNYHEGRRATLKEGVGVLLRIFLNRHFCIKLVMIMHRELTGFINHEF